MTNGQNAARGRHLESLAADAKRFTLEKSLEITEALQDDLAELGGISIFTGATSIAGGLSGLVPAPAIGDEGKFLRGDGNWATVAASGGGDGVVLPTVASSVDGGLWLDTTDKVPKFYYDGKVYPLLCGEGEAPLPSSGGTLGDYTWEQISAISQAGRGADYFNIGDTKKITLNGKIGDYLTLTNEELYVFILHFNYPLNGTADNNIIWGGFKASDGTDVALCDSKYDTQLTDGSICFNPNHRGNNNYGGWKGCDLRYDILGATSTAPSEYGQTHTADCVGYDATAATLINPKADTLLAALPSDFRNVLRLWSRWIDAKGNSSNVEANIEETIDAVTLLTEFEVKGSRTDANEYEQNHQTQMEYYRLGNSSYRYKHDSTSTRRQWWLASPCYRGSGYYIRVSNNIVGADDSWVFGLAPAFMT